VSHVNPFSTGSGQVQRVFNSLIALAEDWDSVTIYTLNAGKSVPGKLNEVHSINPKVKVIYLKPPSLLKVLNPVFHFLPYLGFGKASNWILPYIFNQLDKKDFDNFDCVLFEYWHLYKLARKIRSEKLKVVCDTHNILLGSFREYIGSKPLPGFYKNYLINRYKKLEFKTALSRSFDELIAINREEEAILKIEFPGIPIFYCPMGVKLPALTLANNGSTSKNIYTVAYYGGLGNPRNASAAMDVFKALDESVLNKKGNLVYKIIGSGTPKILSDLAISNSWVKVPGYVEDLSSVLSDVDLAVIPFEGKYGFRSRLIELMHYGIPVLTTDDAIWGMGFTPGFDILIYRPKENLTDKIMEVLNDYDKRKKIVANAKSRIQKEFTFEATYKELSRELKELIA
jgi:glycosyltransferase involved in cell wall biosynthesis